MTLCLNDKSSQIYRTALLNDKNNSENERMPTHFPAWEYVVFAEIYDKI